jgi:hypothetical protein
MQNHTLAKVLVTLFAITFLVVLLFLIFVLLRLNRSEKASRPEVIRDYQHFLAPETYVFHEGGTRGETHVPFRLFNNRLIVVSARINGKPTECDVDTGSPTISWNSRLRLTDQRTGAQASLSDAVGHKVVTEEALLDNIQIGGLELQHMASYAFTSDRPETNTRPILGNSVFAHTILTIDYAKHELTIRPSATNSIPSGVRDRNHSLDFRWVSQDPRGRFGVPCVRGKVMSLPADITIDTGWSDDTVGLARSYYYQLRPALKAKHIKRHLFTTSFVLGNATVITLSNVSWSLPGIAGTSPVVVVDQVSRGAQAVLGRSFLSHFRTTIDYPQQKIWFDPIQATRKHQ